MEISYCSAKDMAVLKISSSMLLNIKKSMKKQQWNENISTGNTSLIVSYRIVWYRMVWYRIVSYRIVSYRIVSYCIELIQKNKWSTPPKKKPKPRLQTLRPSYGKKKKEERIFGIRFFNILLDHIWPWKTASVANWAKYLNSGNFVAGENNNTWNN